MSVDLWGFDHQPFLGAPAGLLGYVLLILYGLGVLLALAGQIRPILRLKLSQWLGWFGLMLAGGLAAQLAVLRIPAAGIISTPGVPNTLERPGLALFALVPAFVAGGWLGIGPAVVVGLFTGLIRTLWESPAAIHSAFTPFEYALMAGLLAWCVQQDYRGWVARFLRRPALCGLALSLLTWPLLYISDYAYSTTTGLVGLDYVASLTGAAAPVLAAEVILAGLFAELARMGLPAWWPIRRGSVAPPYVSSLNRRLLFILIPLFTAGIAVLFWADINISLAVSTSLVEEEMVRAARDAGQEIPYFIQTGRTYLRDVVQQGGWFESDYLTQVQRLSRVMSAVPFFRQLTLFDAAGVPVAGYPVYQGDYGLTGAEGPLVRLALSGGVPQDMAIYGDKPADTGVVFIAPVTDAQTGQTVGAMAGRVDLSANPLMQAVVHNLESFAAWDGQGAILDENGALLYQVGTHPLPVNFEPSQTAPLGEAVAYTDQSPQGRRLVVYHAAAGHPWGVVIVVPYKKALEVATQIAAPVNLILVTVGLIGLVMVSIIATQVTRPAEALALAAQRISEGRLDQAVTVRGEDEIGRAGLAFERMREKLRARLDELSLLLRVSQGVASSLNLSEALPPILQGVLTTTRAAGARIVLMPAEKAGDEPVRLQIFWAGPAAEDMAPLDAGVLALAQESTRNEPAIIENLARARAVLDVGLVSGKLQALLALPLRQESTYYGVLWLGYDRLHTFTQPEVNLLTTLAGQAVVAVTNARLFSAAEHERQRLAAILASTPDAVVVTGQAAEVLWLNPVAEATFELTGRTVVGRPAVEALPHPKLKQMLLAEPQEGGQELDLTSGRTLYASVSPIIGADGEILGKVCVLRDVTHFKELDAMKSEFVATVSHDLRAPLTFMRGYATMLPMVGQLTDKQREFADKIILGIEQMTKLIDALLDLARIEQGVGLSREACRLGDIVGEIVESVTPHAVNRGLNLTLEVQPSLPSFSGDSTLLRQAFMNLVDNAMKYTPAGGYVKVALMLDTDKFRLAVSDSGLGISPADQTRLFQKFFRVRQRGSTQTKGAGLGLAIVKSTVERHGGRVWVESKLGKGSTFYVDLPRNGAPA